MELIKGPHGAEAPAIGHQVHAEFDAPVHQQSEGQRSHHGHHESKQFRREIDAGTGQGEPAEGLIEQHDELGQGPLGPVRNLQITEHAPAV